MYDPGQLYSDPILTQFSIGYQDQILIGERVMPTVGVGTQSGRYRVFDRSNWVIFPDRREPGTVANEVRGGKWSEDTFMTKEHSLQAPVWDEERQQLTSQGGLADATFGGALQLNPEQDATELVTRSILLGHEKRVADTTRNVANYPAGHTVTLLAADQWDNYAGATSNPIDVVRAAILKINAAIGQPPNLIVMPRLGVGWIENHPDVVARFVNFNLTDEDAFRNLTGFTGTVVFSEVVYNSANNIDAAEVLTSLWGRDVWIGYVNPDLTLNDISFGKTFSQVYPDGTIRPTDRWREESRKTDVVRVSQKYDLKITSSTAGYLIKDAFSATAF